MVTGPAIQEKALQFANRLDLHEFKASNGWLARFKSRHNISNKLALGGAGSVDLVAVTDWKAKLPGLISRYNPADIFNMDETGLNFKAFIPNRGFTTQKNRSGLKSSKERLTVALCVNMLGEFETPLVIGKAARPRALRHVKIDRLSVRWTHNSKAWMSSAIFVEWLTCFNKKMEAAGRKVLLMLDNAPAHPKHLKFSNVELLFLPANTTSHLQPLDQGIIKSMKTHYRKMLLRSVLTRIDAGCSDAKDLQKSITVLDACQWVLASSLKMIQPSTVGKCFRHCGLSLSSCELSEMEPDCIPLAQLLTKTTSRLKLPPMSEEEYVAIDEDTPATEELTEDWEENLFS